MRYNNYHKHTTRSSIFTPDSHVHIEDYMKRASSLGHTIYFTTEHGFGGDIFEAMDLKDKYNLKVCFAIEGYIVPNPLEKDNSNYHIVLIARTNEARRKLNKINSRANKEGYYYKPRIFIEDLLNLKKEDIYITTSCVAGIIRDDNAILEIFVPLVSHFEDSIFIEVQSHDEEIQKKHNKKAIQLAKTYGLKLIHANDSHYILPEQAKDRLEYLKGKGISYDDEDNFILDYPHWNTIIERYKIQGILNENQILESLQSTLIFDDCEEIDIDKNIKMPHIYKDISPKQRVEKLRRLLFDKWKIEREKIPKEKHQDYIEAIKFELDIIRETNEEVHTADYFLLNERVVDLAVNKYGGVLTKTGRGSAVSFYINKLLGITGIDRLSLDVPIFPTRFISASRLLESKSLPDVDFNVADPEPFIQATKDLLGENGVAWMIAYGTMKESEAFRNCCRNAELPYDEYNEVAKNLESYENDPKWKQMIEHSKKFVGSIVSVSPHPCALLLLDGDIESEIGVIRVGDKLCAIITSLESDNWKYLKNDYLTVSVWDIISKTFKLVGKEVITIEELINSLDDRIWDLYSNGITATLNQADSDFATHAIKRYKPRSYADVSAFVAAIRPGFASLLDKFLDRKVHTNGVKELDDLLEISQRYMLYQESTMQFLMWLGIPEDYTFGIVKKIAKKNFKEEELSKLEEKLKQSWMDKIGNIDDFYDAWQVVYGSAKYSFNASHSLSVALDSLYGAYLKINHTLEYYKVVLEEYQKDTDKTEKLTNELEYFGIELKHAKFRYANDEYNIDKENKIIYKSISSIKHLNSQVATQLYELRNNKYDSFIDLLKDLNNTSINTRQLDILIKLDFFSEFGKAKKLLDVVEYFNMIYGKKVLNKSKISEDIADIVSKYSRETASQYRDLEHDLILKELCESILDEDISIKEKMDTQKEYLGYIDIRIDTDKLNCVILNLDTKYKPKVTIMSLSTGKTVLAKCTKELASTVDVGDIVHIAQMKQELGWTKDRNDKWVKDPNKKEWHIKKMFKIHEKELYDGIISD